MSLDTIRLMNSSLSLLIKPCKLCSSTSQIREGGVFSTLTHSQGQERERERERESSVKIVHVLRPTRLTAKLFAGFSCVILSSLLIIVIIIANAIATYNTECCEWPTLDPDCQPINSL